MLQQFLPRLAAVLVEQVRVAEDEVLVVVRTRDGTTVPCPDCGAPAWRIHSRYRRRLDDHRSTLPIITRIPIELVIFDCDGVLVDSERICIRVDAMIMADLGCAFTEEKVIEKFVGSSTEVYTAAMEERLGRRLEK